MQSCGNKLAHDVAALGLLGSGKNTGNIAIEFKC